MLSVDNLFCGYNDKDIIKDISFNLEPGSSLCIIGPNGCGKSTLLKSLANLIPYRGSIKIDGIEISNMKRKALAKKIALMTQMKSIYFPYTVYETVALGRYCHMNGMVPRLSSIDKDAIYDSMERLGLLNIRNTKINQLSGGQLQRVFLAKIFAQDPKIILLDEPTNHLDLKYQIEILEYINEWVKQKERAVVAVLHDLNLVQLYCNKVILLNDGKKHAYGTIKDIITGNALEEVYKIDIKNWMTKVLLKWQA